MIQSLISFKSYGCDDLEDLKVLDFVSLHNFNGFTDGKGMGLWIAFYLIEFI